MRIALAIRPLIDEKLVLARQIGVTDIVAYYPGPGFEALEKVHSYIASFGLRLTVIENDVPMDDIIHGGPNRDAQVEAVADMLQSMGKLEIPVWCYCWMPGGDWSRTSVDVSDRGGSLVSQFDITQIDSAKVLDVNGETDHAWNVGKEPTTQSQLWENLEDFLREILPVAESAGVVLAMHPDDPPMSSFLGDAQIMTCPDDLQRLVELVPSPANAITFCQGVFSSMGVDVVENIYRFRDHIGFVHFRDVVGSVPKFTETWHDSGQTDMAACIRAYEEIGFDGPIRPDHVPVLAGESTDLAGYTMLGRLWAIGYMKGLMDAR